MTRSLRLASLCSGLLLLPLSALAGPDEPYADAPDDSVFAESDLDGDLDGDQDDAEPYEAQPPVAVAPPPSATVPVKPPVTPPGEWVETEQYGRIWMPYADVYTDVPFGGYGEPLQYVYYPAYGWTWVAAPWVWGWGPWPTFGFSGPRHFGWYGHGWWRTPSRWHYTPGSRFGGFDRRGWQGQHRGGWATPLRGHGGVRSFVSPGFRGGAPAHRGSSSPGFSSQRFSSPGGGARPSGGGRGGGSAGGHGGGHGASRFGGHGGGHGR